MATAVVESDNDPENIWQLRDAVNNTESLLPVSGSHNPQADCLDTLSHQSQSFESPGSFCPGIPGERSRTVPRPLLKTSVSKRRTLSRSADGSRRSTQEPRSSLIRCDVFLLDGKSLTFHVAETSLGVQLFNLVTTHLSLEQSEYFGLVYYYADKTSPNADLTQVPFSSDDSLITPSGLSTIASRNSIANYINVSVKSKKSSFIADVPFWLKLNRRIVDQCKGSRTLTFHFQVKFYPPNPELAIEDPRARYQLCLQLRQHLITGRLTCSFFTHVLLGGLISQMVLGDSHPRHSLCLDERTSLISTLSSKYAHANTYQALSETRSLLSGRTCSLAAPESSDDDEIAEEAIWYPREEPRSDITRRRVERSLSIRSDPLRANETYLNILPHLNRRSKSLTHQRHTVTNGELSLCPDIESDDVRPVWENLNWPYPPPPSAVNSTAILQQVTHFHRRLYGWSYSKAEQHFLKCVKLLSLYGVELHSIKNFTTYSPHARGLRSFRLIPKSKPIGSGSGKPLPHRLSWRHTVSAFDHHFSLPSFKRAINHGPSTYAYSVGVSSLGILLYWGQVRLALFRWAQVAELGTRQRVCRVVVKAREDKSNKKSQLTVYKFEFTSPKLSTRFHRACVEHHRFFRLKQGNKTPASHLLPAPLTSEPPSLFEPLSTEESPSVVGAESTNSETNRRLSDHSALKRKGSKWLLCWRPRDNSFETPVSSASAQPAPRTAVSATLPRCASLSHPSDSNAYSPWVRARSTSIPDQHSLLHSSNTPRRPSTKPKLRVLSGTEQHQLESVSHSSQPSHIYPDLVPVLVVSRASVRERQSFNRRSITLARAEHITPSSERCEPRRSASVLNRPPPRPKMPPMRRSTIAQRVPNGYTSQNTSSLALAPNSRPGTWHVPVVRTHVSVFTSTGQLVRLRNHSPTASNRSNTASPSSSPWQLRTDSSLPIVRTRSVHYPSNIRVNEYNIVDSAVIRRVSGPNVPRIPTKCLFMQYRQQPFNQPVI